MVLSLLKGLSLSFIGVTLEVLTKTSGRPCCGACDNSGWGKSGMAQGSAINLVSGIAGGNTSHWMFSSATSCWIRPYSCTGINRRGEEWARGVRELLGLRGVGQTSRKEDEKHDVERERRTRGWEGMPRG